MAWANRHRKAPMEACGEPFAERRHRRLYAGLDGPRRYGLLEAKSRLRAMPGPSRLCGPGCRARTRDSGAAAPQAIAGEAGDLAGAHPRRESTPRETAEPRPLGRTLGISGKTPK